jgi:hypothetical protein
MIEINLLPAEYRAKSGTPIARFVAIVGGVVVVAAALGVFAWTHLIELARVRDLHATKEEEAVGKELRMKHSLGLQAEIEMFERRRTAIQTINRSRTLWSQKVDQLFDLVTDRGGDAPYRAWLDSIEVPAQPVSMKSVGGGAPKDGGQVRFKGRLAMQSASDGPAHISAFHRALTGDPDVTGRTTEFFADFQRINNPNLRIVADRGRPSGEPLEPSVVAEFRYELLLHTVATKSAAKNAQPGAGR